MAMIGKVEGLVGQIHPGSRLSKGLSVLMDFCKGHLPEFASIVSSQKPGDKTQLAQAGDAISRRKQMLNVGCRV
jgi:hypothetical protein